MKLIALLFSGLAAIVAAAVLVTPALGTDSTGRDASLAGNNSSPSLDLARALLATARFHSVEQAEAAGYAAASPCVASPEGGMGIHYENPALMADPALDPAHPEILDYEPKANGQLRLVALEYWRQDSDGDLATSDDRPSLFGQAFDGPMPGHSPVMPVHYDLHVWLWKWNPSGLFSAWNPRVSCP